MRCSVFRRFVLDLIGKGARRGWRLEFDNGSGKYPDRGNRDNGFAVAAIFHLEIDLSDFAYSHLAGSLIACFRVQDLYFTEKMHFFSCLKKGWRNSIDHERALSFSLPMWLILG